MSQVSTIGKEKSSSSRITLRQFVWDLTLRRFLRNLLFLFMTVLVALFNLAAAVTSIGLSLLLIAAPYRYEQASTSMTLFFSPVDTMPEALAVGIAGIALLMFSILFLTFIGEVELAAARKILSES